MEIKVTFRHLEPEEELKKYAERELEKLAKYLHKPIEARLVFGKEKKRCMAELNLLGDSDQFFAKEEADDLYLAFDQALDKLKTQIKRHHDRWKRAKPKRDLGEESMVGESTSEFEIIRTNENLVSKPITLEEALNYLNDKQRIFVVFRNAGNERVCVLFRREDGNFGLIEP